MTKINFQIEGMDCAEEVSILKRALVPLLGDQSRLSFDLLRGRLSVDISDVDITEGALSKAIGRTGLKARPWREGAEEAGTFWQRRGRAILCIASGIFLFAGAFYHIFVHGMPDALMGHHGDGHHATPVFALILYFAAILSGGYFVAPKAWFSLTHLRPDMSLLMSLAVVGAIALGDYLEAGSVIFLFSLALLLESWSVTRARRAIESLLAVAPQTARIKDPSGDIIEKPIQHITPGTIVLVRPGEKIPLDGFVITGTTTVNQAPLTGESQPVAKEIKDEVFAGTINNEGAFEFRVSKPADQTMLSRIIRMVQEARDKRAKVERWVDKFAAVYTPTMIGLALLVMVAPPLFFGLSWLNWFYRGLVVLVIACPCALVISTPVSIVAGLTRAAKQGVLIKGGTFLELPARLRAVAFDKTGTITAGEAVVNTVLPFDDHSEEQVLAKAAALEAESQHPLAAAISNKAKDEQVPELKAEDHRLLEGRGASAKIGEREFWIGSHRLSHEMGKETEEHHRLAQDLEAGGNTLVALGDANHVCGVIGISDPARDEARQVIGELKGLGLDQVVMLTGDGKNAARVIADQCGFDAYSAELLPAEKAEAILQLMQKYQKVAMVGDGVNDAPAMASASLGIAMAAAGSDAAIETADIALMSDELQKIPWLIRLSRRTLGVIKQNITLAVGIKVIFLALAFADLATLWGAIAADMGASLLVIGNGLRLLRG